MSLYSIAFKITDVGVASTILTSLKPDYVKYHVTAKLLNQVRKASNKLLQ